MTAMPKNIRSDQKPPIKRAARNATTAAPFMTAVVLVSKSLKVLTSLIAISGTAFIVYASETASEKEVPITSFEFLGCSGDWTDQDYSPEIWRMGADSGMTYMVRHPATCGANAGRGATAKFRSGTLDLHYEPYSKDGVYALCYCDAWAKFTFQSEPASVTSATFDAGTSRLKGSWPER